MSKVNTVRIVDTRIEPQPAPIYATTIGPVQNQFYKIPASGLSNSYVTFNNLTTLGADRAYLDTFELEITAEITFNALPATAISEDLFEKLIIDRGREGVPARYLWTFDSFPFNKVCEEIRVNINGGAFFSSPLSYLRAKERYWDEKKIAESYGGICPCHKACMANESGLRPLLPFPEEGTMSEDKRCMIWLQKQPALGQVPSRTLEQNPYMKTASGFNTNMNNSFVPAYEGTGLRGGSITIPVTWREPIFASPFSSKIDGTYGRPLYNITSIDIAMNMMDLRNMLRVIDPLVDSYSVNITAMNLCYQVETVPTGIAPPLTVVPYRRFVPYITDYKGTIGSDNRIHVKSGVYTMNEVPTAIWAFAAPTKAMYQTYQHEGFQFYDRTASTQTPVFTFYLPNSTNKTFGFIDDISISLANTTQILSTAAPQDLFRICKANGLQDSYDNWNNSSNTRSVNALDLVVTRGSENLGTIRNDCFCQNVGSVLRLIPGTDLVIPDQDLLPGANANNLVFTVEATFRMPQTSPEYKDKWALWLLFEYVGVATITPGQCEITMNPLGNGAIMKSAPIVSATPSEEPSTTEGSGFFDKVADFVKNAWNFAKNNKIVSSIGRVASMIPHPVAQGIGQTATQIGNALGMGGIKRPRLTGGARMGLGDFI